MALGRMMFESRVEIFVVGFRVESHPPAPGQWARLELPRPAILAGRARQIRVLDAPVAPAKFVAAHPPQSPTSTNAMPRTVLCVLFHAPYKEGADGIVGQSVPSMRRNANAACTQHAPFAHPRSMSSPSRKRTAVYPHPAFMRCAILARASALPRNPSSPSTHTPHPSPPLLPHQTPLTLLSTPNHFNQSAESSVNTHSKGVSENLSLLESVFTKNRGGTPTRQRG